jgi:uncharacterized membrane protein
MNSIPGGDAFRFSWEKTKSNLKFFIVSYIVSGLALIPSGIFLILTAVFAARSDWAITAVFGILMVLAFIATYAGLFIAYVKASMLMSAGEEVAIRDCMPTFDEWWKVLLANCIYFTGIGIGTLFCIIPGIWVAVKYWGYCWFIVEKGAGPVEALKEAGELSTDLVFDLLVFFVICGIIMWLGALVLLVGLIVAFPVVLMATTYVFRKLANMPVVG